MTYIFNLDLLSVGVAVAGMVILGFVSFFNNPKSISNRVFLYLAISASLWGIINYSSYQVFPIVFSFWLLRFVMFFAVWSSFFTFTLSYVFPLDRVKLSPYFKWVLVPLTIVTAFLTLTPLVFTRVAQTSADGRISSVINGPGIIIFGILVIFLNVGGVTLLIRKIIKSERIKRKPMEIVLFGEILMLFLIIVFNFILPAFFGNPRFIPLGAVFLFPFIAFTSYAIFKHNLLSIKIITTEILTFVLLVVIALEVILSANVIEILFRSAIFILVLAFGILLIQSVRREVEQRERLEVLTKELQAANEKLKELDKLKSEFLSFASHQIKSPMAVVKGFAQLIYDGSYGAVPDKVKETAGRIKESVDKLISLVNNFLDLRKIEEGKMEYKFESINVIELVQQITYGLSLLAKQKGLDLSFEAKDGKLKAQVDVQRFTQVIQNLIDNAIKYTDKGFVKVGVTKQNEDQILISVSDSGRGMSKEFLSQAFLQFTREAAAAKEKQGTGLGLFIAKQIVTEHKGDIWAESDGLGKGSKFLVKLPLEKS